ncbi:MAG: MFS transporter [Legionellales bacterium]|nr:MFS transporter [Legionellales bacterium]
MPKIISQRSPIIGWFICGLAAVFYCYEYFLRIAPSVMSNDLRAAYHLDASSFGQLVGFYYFAYTPMQLVVGVLMDRYGPRRLLFVACLICAMGAYLFAATQNLYLAETGRFLIGLGSAFAFVGVMKLASIWLPPERFALAAGLTTSLGMCGAILGDNILDGIVKNLGWRTTTFDSAILGLIVAVAIIWLIRDTKRVPFNPPPTTQQTWVSLWHGLKRIFTQPQMWLIGLLGCLCYTSASAFAEMWGIPYLTYAKHLSNNSASSVMSLVFVGWLMGCPVAGWLSDRLKQRRLIFMFTGITTGISFLLLFFIPNHTVYSISVLLFIIGFCSGGQVLCFACACDINAKKLAGTALAFTNMIVMISGDILQPLIGKLLDYTWAGATNATGERLYDAHAFHLALLILPLFYFSAFVLAKFFLKETYPN